MDTARRFARYLPLIISLIIISQIETACSQEQPPQPSGVHYYSGMEEARKQADKLQTDRKVIVSHNLALEVGEVGPSFEAAIKLATDNGGYISSTNQTRQPDGSYSGTIMMRVPSTKADIVLAEIRKLGKVVSESSTGDDITEQYVDLEARLANARASEKRLAGMMANRTAKLADVLEVERELTRVRGDIESMEGKKRYWDTLTSMVSIQVELTEPPSAMPSLHKIWLPIKTALGKAAEGFAQSLHYAIIFLGMLIPWLIVLGIPVYVASKIYQRRKKNKP